MTSKSVISSHLGSLAGSVQISQHSKTSRQTFSNQSARMKPTISNISVLPTTQQTKESTNLNSEIKRPATSYSARPTTAATIQRYNPPKVIMSITEGRGVAIEIGICIFDVNSCEAILSQV